MSTSRLQSTDGQPMARSIAGGRGMTARFLISEAREFPATFGLCASWLVVFVLMVLSSLHDDGPLTWMRFLVSGIGSGGRLGDLSLVDVMNGQVWRLITCNFVHFSVLHLGLNLLAMYQLGTLIESWYGSAQLLAIYTLTGVFGNVIGLAFRWGLGIDPRVHSGGGSVVLLGLVGLCAVVGWRTRLRMGPGLFRQTMLLLGLTLLIGLLFPRSIDNCGHLGGAILGAILGWMHGFWLSRCGRPSGWGSGVLATIVLVVGGLAQGIDDARQGPSRQARSLSRKLLEHERLEQSLAVARSLLGQGADVSGLVSVLDGEPATRISSRTALDALRHLLKVSASRKLGGDELKRFDELASPLIKESKRESLRIRGTLWRLERASRR